MRVAFFTYPSAFQNIGGGEILLLKLREYLVKAGLEVDLFDTWTSRVEQYDLIHVFGSVKDCLGLVRVANVRGTKVAITPLIWSDWRHGFFSDGSAREKAVFIARHWMKVLWPSFPSARRSLLLASELVFPNSEMERKQIARLFAVPDQKMKVVYNGVDASFQRADPVPFREKYGDASFVLGVGRIEPRKNQLNLIRAMKGVGVMRLVLIGSPVSGYESYYERCLKEGAGFTTFIPTLPHDEALLASAYAACALFVLQGWFETPGLAALEATLAGAKILVTKGGSTREYFEGLVEYLDPSNPTDMRMKIEKSLRSPADPALRQRVLERYTWDKVAETVVKRYREVVG